MSYEDRGHAQLYPLVAGFRPPRAGLFRLSESERRSLWGAVPIEGPGHCKKRDKLQRAGAPIPAFPFGTGLTAGTVRFC